MVSKHPHITAEELRQQIHYDPETGQAYILASKRYFGEFHNNTLKIGG